MVERKSRTSRRRRALLLGISWAVVAAGVSVRSAPGASAEVPPPPDAGTCSWVKANTGDTSSNLSTVFALDASHLYATGAPGPSGHAPLWVTEDGGATWHDIAPPGQLGQHFGVAFLDVDHGVLTSPRGIWTTADGGNTWSHATPAPTPDSWSWNDVAYVDESHIWAVGSSGAGIGAVIFSSDGGVTWTAQTSTDPTEVGLFGVDFVDATHGWAVGWGGVVLATSDGSTWQTQRPSDPGTYSLYDVDFVDSAHGVTGAPSSSARAISRLMSRSSFQVPLGCLKGTRGP
jgi:photosystem II stability/assembly factor-like uncharacterized protein